MRVHIYNFGGRNGAGAPKQAKDIRALISRIFSVASGISTKGAVPVPWIPKDHPNPGMLSEELEYKPKQYSPTESDLSAFMSNGSQHFGRSWKPLLFQAQTFSRVSEVAGMLWEHVDLTSGVWTIPETNSKNMQEHKVYLSSQSLQLLSDLGCEKSGSVFGVTKDYTCHMVADRRKLVGMNSRMSSHDLRRAGLTWVQEMGGSKDIRDRLSTHVARLTAWIHDVNPSRREFCNNAPQIDRMRGFEKGTLFATEKAL